MPRPNWTLFELSAGSLDGSDLTVTRITGLEGLSELFSFDVDFFTAPERSLDLHRTLGTQGVLTFRDTEGGSRTVQGLISRIELREVHRVRHYRLRLVPQLDRSRHVRRSRIFQNLSIPEIVEQVLDEDGIQHREALGSSYSPRDFVVQYRESNLHFVMRLLEAEGIFFFFESSGEVVVLADAGSACNRMSEPNSILLQLHTQGEKQALGEEEHVFSLEAARGLVSEKVTLRDYDFERPALDLTVRQPQDSGGALEIYDTLDRYADAGRGGELAKMRLEEARFGFETIAGGGTCHRLSPGFIFRLKDPGFGLPKPPPLDPLLATGHDLLPVRVEHSGEQQIDPSGLAALSARYENRFSALLASAPFRPERKTRRPILPGAQTATVVGPPGEEIHVDRYGRVKVQFHWDREGKNDDRSSCWVRLKHAWAGPGFGASFVPRIGQEVVVRFIEGDPDQPMVVGAVFNGDHPTAVVLPENKTQSTLRTQSSPRSGHSPGFNELRFEDAAQREELYLHGQKDEKIVVVNDQSQWLGHNERLGVGADRQVQVHGNHELRVSASDTTVVHGDQILDVSGDRTVVVSSKHSENVIGSQSITVSGPKRMQVAAASATQVLGAAELQVGGAYEIGIALGEHLRVGSKSEQVGDCSAQAVGREQVLRVRGDCELRVGENDDLHADGSVSAFAVQDLTERIGNNSSTRVEENVELLAEAFKVKADNFEIYVNGKLVLSAANSGAVRVLGANVTVDGSQLTLKAPNISKTGPGAQPSRSSSGPAVQTLDFIELRLKDQHGKPVPRRRYRVEPSDGTVREGFLNDDGFARIERLKPGNVIVTFPEIDGSCWDRAPPPASAPARTQARTPAPTGVAAPKPASAPVTPAAPAPAQSAAARSKNWRLGNLSAKYESNGNPGTVSTGTGDAGGVSYGSYQLATKRGSPGRFVTWLKTAHPDMHQALVGKKPGTAEFTAAWKELARKDAAGFGEAQHAYIQFAYYEPARHGIEALYSGFSLLDRSKALNDVLWSTSVQHGFKSAVSIFKKAIGKESAVEAKDSDLIRRVYAERGRTNTQGGLVHFSGCSVDVQKGVTRRFKSEEKEALAALSSEGVS